MKDSNQQILVITATAFLAVGSIPHIIAASQARSTIKRRYELLTELYEDEDGVADEESQAAHNDHPQRIILILGSLAGVILSVADAVLTAKQGDQRLSDVIPWLSLASWLVLLFQSINIYITVQSLDRSRLGAWNGLSSLILGAVFLTKLIISHSPKHQSFFNLSNVMLLGQAIVAVIVSFTSVLIPRRPDVYQDGRPVDREYTVSFASRFTFSWPAKVLHYAASNQTLKHADIPMISHSLRAKTLREEWEAVGKKDKLWKKVFWAHRNAFIAQWFLQILTAGTNFLPQLVLYAILRLLEQRETGKNDQFALWVAALLAGLSVALGAWLESLLFYVCFLKLGVPIYEQLSVIIFGKALRKKDVKSAAKVDQEAEIAGEISTTKTTAPEEEEETLIVSKEEDSQDDEEVTKTKQSTINLIGVDGKRVGDFCTYNYLILGSVVKLGIAIVFLVQLVGWIPMLAGFAVLVAISPVNWFVSKKYGAAQDELMKYRDQKMAVVSEALQGIRQIKFGAAESEWYERIMKTRRKELNEQWRVFRLDTILISCWIFCPAIMTVTCLATYALFNGGLSASIAFTTVSVFEAIEMSLSVLPEVVTEAIDAFISARRIQTYLDSAELTSDLTPGDRISFSTATISWPSDEAADSQEIRSFTLQDLSLEFQHEQLNVIAGKTGSGKSLLLSSIIGEADILSGSITVPRAVTENERFDGQANKSNWILPEAIAFVSQVPYVENATLRDNILFGLPFDQDRYQQVLDASALTKDLEVLPDGEMTEIGAQGVNLSGGQKWRTCFARALYSRAGILVLDDIFSAVDAHVGRQLFENALTGSICQGRTRILVTHHVSLCLPKTAYLVYLQDGQAVSGTVSDMRKKGHLQEILALEADEQSPEPTEDVIDDGDHLAKIPTNQSQKSRRASSQAQTDRANLLRQQSRASVNKSQDTDKLAKKFVEEEARAIGQVTLATYTGYLKACRGYLYWICLGGIFVLWIGVYLARNYWLTYWTRQPKTSSHTVLLMQSQIKSSHRPHSGSGNSEEPQNDTVFYISIYLGISVAAWLVATTRYFGVYVASIKGSHVLFEQLLHNILRSPLRFLDTTPLGRILNRFTADFNMVDSRMANDLGYMLHCMLSTVSVIIVGMFVSPLMLLFSAVLFAVMLYYARLFLAGAREVKRLESTAKSPIFEQFNAVLSGITTIRAYDRTLSYEKLMDDKINTHSGCYYFTYAFSRWMSFRANMMGAIFIFAAAALIVSLKDIDAALAGFVLSFSLELSEVIIWSLRLYTNVELNFNAVERVLEYAQLPTEDQGGQKVPAAWPTQGRIDFDNLTVSYAPDLPPVLKGLTLSISANERVGIVGRTGAGKSSLTLALFRFLEASAGSISIDGLDISKLNLQDLRSRMNVIPQDPVIFSGTVRSNLDPFDTHTDVELRDALARANLLDPALGSKAQSGTTTPIRRIAIDIEAMDSGDGAATPTNKNIALGLSTRISESGLNLSQGQRQLLCLARAIVSRPKILVLDEATSSVDMETDQLIQQSIREEFGGRCTLVVIAHRLSTIADFDRVLVLSQGQVLEYGTPRELFEAKEFKEGSFREMIDKSGERGLLEDIIYRKSKPRAM